VRRFTPWFALVLCAAVTPMTVGAQSQGSSASSSSTTQSSDKPKASNVPAKPRGTGTGASLLHPDTLKAKAPEVYEVTFDTTKGQFVIQVTRAWAPQGADRFYNLVKNHFYDGASFFRVVPTFVVQFGLTGNPAVNKAWTNATIKDDPVTQKNAMGTITFATAGKDSRTTQVFVNLGDNSRLDAMGFSPFGKVISGMEVINQLYSGYADNPTGHQGEITNDGKAYLDKNWPKLDSIKTATITSPAPTTATPAKKSAAAAPKS
jgi:peptidyl-prolyl cis-trans isomerase A (cyclophilin A)